MVRKMFVVIGYVCQCQIVIEVFGYECDYVWIVMEGMVVDDVGDVVIQIEYWCE